MADAVALSVQRTEDYDLYFRLMSEGLETRTVFEFRDEMEVLAMHAADPCLRAKALQEMHRYDGTTIMRSAGVRTRLKTTAHD